MKVFMLHQGAFTNFHNVFLKDVKEVEQTGKNQSVLSARMSQISVAVANARSFIIDNHSLSLPFYFFAPGVNGEVMIEFKNGKRAAELYFLADGTNEFFLFVDDEDVLESILNEGFRLLIHFLNP